jgi:RNA polymerase sigma-70 factor, ECF subfamily
VTRDEIHPTHEIERLVPLLRRYAHALVAHVANDPRAEADALVRDTLARVPRTDRAVIPRISLYATLTTLNRARLRAMVPPPATAVPETEGMTAAAAWASHGVTQALDALALDQREALLLVALEGFSYAEAADVLGVSRQALAARITRARATLGEHLDVSAGGEGRAKPRQPPHLRLIK